MVCRVSFQFEPELPARPASGTVTTDYIFGVYDFCLPGLRLALAGQVIFVIILLCEVASKEPVRHLAGACLLLRGGLFLGEVLECDLDGVTLIGVQLGLVDRQGCGQDTALDLDGVFGMLLDVVEEEALDAALVEDYLLEP